MIFGRTRTEKIDHVLSRVGNGPLDVFIEPCAEVPEFAFIDRCPRFNGADSLGQVSNGAAGFGGLEVVEAIDGGHEPGVVASSADQRVRGAVDDVVFDEPGDDVVPRSPCRGGWVGSSPEPLPLPLLVPCLEPFQSSPVTRAGASARYLPML